METDQAILGFLMSGPKTGYKIKSMTGKLMMSYNLSLNQIYPALRRLETAGLVKKEVVYQTGKPNKHVYTLTQEGKEEFKRALTGPPVPIDYQLDFLIKAFFFRFLEKGEVIRQFEQEISSLEEQLQDLEQIREDVEQRSDEDGLFIYSTIVGMIEMLKDRYTRELEERRAAEAGPLAEPGVNI
jgi:DNA-binding PadR family transcriptional regulator